MWSPRWETVLYGIQKIEDGYGHVTCTSESKGSSNRLPWGKDEHCTPSCFYCIASVVLTAAVGPCGRLESLRKSVHLPENSKSIFFAISKLFVNIFISYIILKLCKWCSQNVKLNTRRYFWCFDFANRYILKIIQPICLDNSV